jgi:2-polyprenyl-3-methyl-5-hydroxy-6-metoxy-1,4-benzoquinol methylase
VRLAQWKSAQARIWGSAGWQAIAESELFRVHDTLVERLTPAPGERWLDLATGTGAVALRAARAGAEVTAQDLAPGLIETAKKIAAREALMSPAERDALHLDWVAYFERYRGPDGISAPRPYLLVVGRRR